jgi:ABC-type transporter Mla subunit MlaD
MSQKPHHFRIGLFVLGGVLLVVAGLLAFGLRDAFETRHRLLTYIPGDVEGLVVGSPVKLKGVNVGKVTGLYFSWNRYPGTKVSCVIVEFEVGTSISPIPIESEEDFEPELKTYVERGLRAIMKSQPITGAAFLELEILDPKANPPLAYDWPRPRYPYVPSAPSDFTQVFSRLNRVFEKLERVDIDAIAKKVDGALAAAEKTLERFGRFDAEGVSGEAIGTLKEADATVREIRDLALDARTKVQGLETAEVGRDLRRLIAGIEETNGKVQLAVDRLAGVDVRELNDTLGELRVAVRGLAEALATVRKQPSQLILGNPPEPAAAVGKEERK